MNIRAPAPSDLPAIELVLEDTGLFPPDMLEELIGPFLNDAGCQDRWLVCETDAAGVIGFSFTRPETLAEGAWNLLAIGFRDAHKNMGYGTQLLAVIERSLAGERILIIETSSLDNFDATRRFYESRGYTREAVIRDYWADGDDKVIFRKALGT